MNLVDNELIFNENSLIVAQIFTRINKSLPQLVEDISNIKEV